MKFSWPAAFFLLISISVIPLYALSKEETTSYRVTRSDYTLSSVFEMTNEKTNFGSVVKNIFHVATHYDSYDRYGLYEGQGICRILTLGLIYTWAAEIDIYDAHGDRIGMIDGQVISSEPAKFSFYDAEGNRICIAYLDQHCTGFVFVDPDNSAFILAHLTRNFIVDTIDNWEASLYHPERLPKLFLKIFAAFACDTQNDFKPDL